MTGVPGQVIAGCFALCAFATALLSGLAAGNTPGTILGRAILLMAACYAVGLVIGMVCEAAVRRQLDTEERDAGVDIKRSAETAPAGVSGEVVDNEEVFIV